MNTVTLTSLLPHVHNEDEGYLSFPHPPILSFFFSTALLYLKVCWLISARSTSFLLSTFEKEALLSLVRGFNWWHFDSHSGIQTFWVARSWEFS